ncbi:MAG: sterol desaturase family protein [Gammaproteobacteria bacterium]
MPYEIEIRIGFFVAILAVMILWEFLAPRRALSVGRLIRWPSNIAVIGVGTVLLRVLPFSAVGVAVIAGWNDWGLLRFIDLPYWLAVALAVILLDLLIYGQHVVMHAVPILWRLHRMHHADLDFDVTTGVRFHPIEILLSMIIKLIAIAALGAPALGVLIFEILLNGTSLFNHSNVRIPLCADRYLRWIIVTPDMHRVHHSIIRKETDSNFGFNVPWWDRLFGTYCDQPQAGHDNMTIGIPHFRNPRELWLDRLLIQPFRVSKA